MQLIQSMNSQQRVVTSSIQLVQLWYEDFDQSFHHSSLVFQVEENEAVVQYALKNRPVKLVETGLEFGVEGFTKYEFFH